MNENTTHPTQPEARHLDRAGVITAASVTLQGTTARLVATQAEPAAGQHGGLVVLGPDGYNMVDARDRVYAGIINSGMTLPIQPMTVSLPPGDDPAPGPEADLAVAAVLMAAAGLIPQIALAATVLIGEVGLDGAIRPVRGAQPMVRGAVEHGFTTVVVPAANASEAQLGSAVDIVAVHSLQQFAAWAVTGHRPPLPESTDTSQLSSSDHPAADLAHVPIEMVHARWALEVAAVGGHHLGMVGPIGAGKALLAYCLPSLLPDLDDEAALEVTALRSAAGLHPSGLVRRPPLRVPHHTATVASLLGGGPRASIPGEVSLAHHGVLFLDFSDRPVSVRVTRLSPC